MRLNAEKCLYTGSKVPLGYKIVDKHFVIDEENAAVVKEIFEMYANGKTVTEIINILNARGLKTANGGSFNKNSLHRMFSNKKYIGVYSYSDIIIKDGVPRIISDELFNKVQEIMKKNKQAPARTRAKEDYILTTKLFCGHCKDMMTGVCGTSATGQKYHYYACNNAKKKLCNKKKVSKHWIEDLVIAKCIEILDDTTINMIAESVEKTCEKDQNNPKLQNLKKLLLENERKQSNLKEAVSECSIENVRKSLYEELNKLIIAHSKLKQEIDSEELNAVYLSATQVKFFLKQIKDNIANDIIYKKALIAALINAIYLYDDKITIIFNAGDRKVDLDVSLINDIEQKAKSSLNGSLGVPN